MKQEKIKEIRLKLAVFDFGRLQELLTLFNVLEREELTLEDVREFVEAVKEFQKAREAAFNKLNKEREKLWNKGTRKCPTCTKPLALRPINTPKGKANREGYTCHWYCQDDSCNFEEYTHENFQEVYKKIMGRR